MDEDSAGSGPSDARRRSVTVVIPTKDRRPLLERALRCVLGQQDVTVDVVVVDDGSTDGTAAWLDALDDRRVVAVHRSTPGGVANARNTGLERARGQWVAFLDDDDLWGPRRLARQLDALQHSGAGWACSDAVLVDGRLAVIGVQAAPVGVDVRRQVLSTNVVPGGASAVLASTALVRDLGGFDASCNPVEDWDLWTRLAQAAPVASVPHPDVGYLLHAGSMSTDVARMSRGRDALLAKHRSTRDALGVRADEQWWDSYVLGLHLGSGDRIAAARAKAELLQRSGQWRHAVGAGAVLLAPRAVAARQRRRLLAAYAPSLLAEAERWLAPLR